MKKGFDFLILFLTSLGIITILLKLTNIPSSYQFVVFLPILFLLFYLIFIREILIKADLIITYLFISMCFIRYVLGPFLIAITGVGDSISYVYLNQNDMQKAMYLMFWEMIALHVAFYFLCKYFRLKINKIKTDTTPKLIGNKGYYLAVVIISFIIFMAFGYGQNLVNFILIKVEEERHGDLDDTRLVLIRQILISGVTISFLLIINRLYKLHSIKKNQIFFYFAIAASFIHIGIIIGERRSIQLYTAFVSIFLLSSYFKKYKKRIVILVSTFALVILTFMSIYKFNSAFLYDSYSDALQENELNIAEYSAHVQAYFLGAQNVGITVAMANYVDTDIFQVLYDHGRAFFGMNFLLKGLQPTSSDLFNSFIYGTYMPSGHVISGIGYGYLNFGFILSPLFVILNLCIAFICEYRMKNTISLEMKYLYSYIFIRFTTSIFSSTPPLINIATIMLGTLGLIYFIAVFLNLPKNQYIKKTKIRVQ